MRLMFTYVLGRNIASTVLPAPKLQALFTTSFLQPLSYLVTPSGPENCQPTSSFLLVLKQ